MADTDSRAGTVYHSTAILDWVAKTHAAHDPSLERAFSAPLVHGLPQIQLGPSEGRLVDLLVRLAGARKVVEIGTLAGYSAIRLARGVAPEGRVWTIEAEPRHAQVARDNIQAAGLTSSIEVLEGRAVEVLPALEALGPFCAVFVDADKESYDQYGRWAARNVRRGGLLLGDNAFLFGELLASNARAAAMRRFHEEAREAFDTVCIPTPDGLLLGLRR